MAVSAKAPSSVTRAARLGGLRSVRWGWLAVVAGAHAAGIVALSGSDRVSPAKPMPQPALLVQFIAPAEPAPAAAPPAPPPPPTPPPVVREPPKPPKPAPPRPEARPKRPRPPEPAPVKEPPAARPPVEEPAPAPEDVVPPATVTEAPRTPLAPVAPPAAPAAPTAPAAASPKAAPPPVVAARYDAAYLHNPRPAYPRLSRHRREEGQVVLRVRVLSDGRAETVEIAESSNHPRLDKAALEAVREWRFVPARQGETAVDSWLRVPIVFRLEE